MSTKCQYFGVPPPLANRPALVGLGARSPIGAVHGALSGWHPIDLLAHVLDALAEHCEAEAIDRNAVDRVVVANASPAGALSTPLRSLALARHWSGALPGIEIGGRGLAGHQALSHATELVAKGLADNVIVCGVDMASVVPPGALLLRRDYGKPLTPGTVRELAAAGGHLPDGPLGDTLGFNRHQLDDYVRASLQAAADWPTNATPTDSVINDPERTTPYRGPAFTTDESLGQSVDVLRDLDNLPPMFDPEGVITARSLAQPGDGAVALLVSAHVGTHQVGRSAKQAESPADPIGPMVAALNELDAGGHGNAAGSQAVAVAEPSAAHTLAFAAQANLDPDVVNPHGGAVARGRLDGLETLQGLLDLLGSSPAATINLVSCSGDGEASATAFRRVAE